MERQASTSSISRSQNSSPREEDEENILNTRKNFSNL
jgi:hypothetical protein